MQGLDAFIPSEEKAAYINLLLSVGFHTIDFGSFVSPRAIPQMRDTAEVLDRLDMDNTDSRLLAIVANERGAQDAVVHEKISYLGYPFSISETFQQRNARSGISESVKTVESIATLCGRNGKGLVVYLSMAFGNPYGDPWSPDIAGEWVKVLAGLGVTTISLADTVGIAGAADIEHLFSTLAASYPGIEFGVHLHCRPGNWRDKTDAAYRGGCRRFDSAIKGFGGCPMANDDLVGNLATENLIQYLEEKDVETGIDKNRFIIALKGADTVFA